MIIKRLYSLCLIAFIFFSCSVAIAMIPHATETTAEFTSWKMGNDFVLNAFGTSDIEKLKKEILSKVESCKERQSISQEDLDEIISQWKQLKSLHVCNLLEEFLSGSKDNWQDLENFKTKKISLCIHPDKYPEGPSGKENATQLFKALDTARRENPLTPWLNERKIELTAVGVQLGLIKGVSLLDKVFPSLLKNKENEQELAAMNKSIDFHKDMAKRNYQQCKKKFEAQKPHINKKV